MNAAMATSRKLRSSQKLFSHAVLGKKKMKIKKKFKWKFEPQNILTIGSEALNQASFRVGHKGQFFP